MSDVTVELEIPDDLLPVRLTLRVCERPSPTARALRTLEILQTRPGATADELADRLGVTERAARRYVEILREAGIPVESARGPLRRLPARPRDPAPAGRVHPDRGARPGHGRARRPPERRRRRPRRHRARQGDPGTARERRPAGGGAAGARVRRTRPVRPAPTPRSPASWSPPSPPDAACWSPTAASPAASGTPRSTRGRSSCRYGRWYLLCHSHRADAIRTYRIDRVHAVEQTDRTFTPPDGPRSGRRARGAPRHRMAVPHPRGVRRPAAEGRPVDPAADGPARTVRRRVRAGRQHAQPGDVRPGVAGERALPFRVEGGPELREAVAEVASRS